MGTVAFIEVNLNSERAIKARVTKWLSIQIVALFRVLFWVFIVGGLSILIFGYSIGWFLICLAALPFMVYQWYDGDLKNLPPAQGNSIDSILSVDILSHLSNRMSPLQIGDIVARTQSCQFMAARCGLTPNLLANTASKDVKLTDDLWQKVIYIKEKTGSEIVHGGVVALAILQQNPHCETILAHMHVDENDVMECIRWYNRLQKIVDSGDSPKRTGGIARDWSFGYTPLLDRFGIRLGAGRGLDFSMESGRHQEIINQLINNFGTGGRQNAALVGPTGVGKTAILHSFASRLLDAAADIPNNLKFRQVFLLDSSALISAAPGRGELEGLVMRVLGEAFTAKNIIICLDNAQLFFEEGVGSIDISNVLLPILEAGNLRVILTMDDQQFLQISHRNPILSNALNRIVVGEPEKKDTITAMQDQILTIEYKRKVIYMYQSLIEAYRLSERYIHDLAMPGRAVKLLESAANYAEGGGLVTMNSVQQAIEKTMDVKVSVASSVDDREMLLNLEDRIHKRMINQTHAVKAVSDALRRARAGVRNQNRPIGTFLFLGPTGVGKTELAKALAEVYFGGEDNIVRLDLNEYVGLEDVSRLIADASSDPNSLTAKILKQPFSVVLLDEIEKAHPNVLTTLLQLLDEGILRDINNREVSFRDAIVIATSNAGADRIREYIERGYKVEQFESQIVNELIKLQQFKPEFLNRFDEITVFSPLGKRELLQVVDIMLTGINKTLAQQKVQVKVDDDAKILLVENGYDPQLGARPMRRIIQKTVENTVAKEMLSGLVAPGGIIEIHKRQIEEALGING